jgi:hypothetical protein
MPRRGNGATVQSCCAQVRNVIHVSGGRPATGGSSCISHALPTKLSDEEVVDRGAAVLGRLRHDETAESFGDLDKPGSMLRVDSREESVEPAIVERAVRIGQVPVGLGQTYR